MDRIVRLEEVGKERPRDERRPCREAELPGPAEEVVVAPAREPAHLLLGVVADAEPDLARRQLREPQVVVDLGIRALVLVEADRREEIQPGELVAGVVEPALPERLAAPEGDLPPNHVLAHVLVAGDLDVAEDARRAAQHAIEDVRHVLAEVDLCLLSHDDAGKAILAIVAPDVREARVVRLLREDLALGDGKRRHELRPLLRGERLAGEVDVHVADVNRRALLDPQDGRDRAPLGR
jgi:hypothetical protein